MLASAAVSTVAPKYTRSLHNFAETAWCTLGPWGLSPYFFDNCDRSIIGAMNREKDLVVWIIQREAATQIFFKPVVMMGSIVPRVRYRENWPDTAENELFIFDAFNP